MDLSRLGAGRAGWSSSGHQQPLTLSCSPVSPRAPTLLNPPHTNSSFEPLCWRPSPLAPSDCDAAGGGCSDAARGVVAGERGLGSGQPWAEAGRVDVWDGSHLARGKTGQLSAGICPLNLAFRGSQIIGCISPGIACQVSVLDICKQAKLINIRNKTFPVLYQLHLDFHPLLKSVQNFSRADWVVRFPTSTSGTTSST